MKRPGGFSVEAMLAAWVLASLMSCASAPEVLLERGADVMREADLKDSDAPWAAFDTRIEKAKGKPGTAHAAVMVLDDWAVFYLKRNEPDKALSILDEADAVPLSIDFTRYRRRTMIYRAVATYLKGDAENALAMLEKARAMRDPHNDDGLDPRLGYAEVYILQSLGRYKDATEAGKPYLADKYASSLNMIRSALAWNAIRAGKPEDAIRYNKTSDWTEPHRKLIHFIAQLDITGPEGAELQAKQWLEYGSPKTRRDWLIDERYISFPIDDPKTFFRAEYDEARLKALASYAIALGPNTRKPSGSALEYRLPVSSAEAFAAEDPYAVDYAYAEAIMRERHSSAPASEKTEAYRAAAAAGQPRMPWGLEAYASYLIWKNNDPAGGTAICRLGMEIFPDDQAPFKLLLAQKAYRDLDFDACIDLLVEVSKKEANGLGRDRMVLGMGLLMIASSPETMLRMRDEWAAILPESAAVPYLGALGQFRKEGTNAYMRGQKENWKAWFDSSSGDPRQALLYDWMARVAGKID